MGITVPSPKVKPAPKPAESKPEYKMVLKVSSQCDCGRCKKEFEKISTIKGVRTVGIDFMQQEVKVVVVGNFDSKTLINKLEKKTGKHAELWPQEGDQKQNKQENGKSEPKSSGVEEKKQWVLKVPLHCEIGCPNDVKEALKTIKGVHTVDIDIKEQTVTVVGDVNVDSKTLIKELKKKTGKQAELLWPQKRDQKRKEQGKGKSKEKESNRKSSGKEEKEPRKTRVPAKSGVENGNSTTGVVRGPFKSALISGKSKGKVRKKVRFSGV